MKKLIIVESPHKAETISAFLDNSYIVVATKGHIKNLPKKEFGIEKGNKVYKGKWIVDEHKKKMLSYIKSLAKDAKEIYIATDDDREGERIGWDVVEYLKLKNYYRITFHEITKKAVLDAISNPDYISENIVNAQMARRMIDRILGYPISSMIRWFFRKNGIANSEEVKSIGIGRVSAPALNIIVKNEEKIENFIPNTYKKVAIDYFYDNMQFRARNTMKFSFDKEEELRAFRSLLLDPQNKHIVEKYKQKTEDRVPPPPLTTSWLQRGANYQFGFRPEKTMKLAQELYEGIMIEGKRYGLITYIRTDSYHMSDDAVYKISELIVNSFGEEYLFNGKRDYTKSDIAQEAHEAIRPTYYTEEFSPDFLLKYLSDDQYKLYKYIYLRAIVTQMKASIYDKSEVVINIAGNKFKTIANKQIFDGWEKIGTYWQKEDEDDYLDDVIELPDSLHPGLELRPIDVVVYKIKEKTPPRFGIGRFITTLEKNAIARPSTISGIVPNLENKGYIKIINNIIHPTLLGKKVIYFLQDYAPWLISIEHALEFEEDLSLIEEGKKDKNELISEYESLKDELAKKLNYQDKIDNNSPEPWLIEKAKKIANKKNIKIDNTLFNDRAKLIEFINKNGDKPVDIGRCPSCKKGRIIEREKGFMCNNKECDFILWKKNIEGFFNNFQKYIPPETLKDYISIILKNKKCYIDDLKNKQGKSFGAYILIEYNKQYDSWQFKLSFPRSKQIDDKYIVNNKQQTAEEKTDNNIQDNTTVDPEKEELLRKIEKIERERRLLKEIAIKDHLTRAYNRECFSRDINIFFKKRKDSLVLAFVDGDKFKNVNDTYGHQAGDEVLKFITNKMFEISKEHGRSRVYRYGGEEFIILFNDDRKSEVIKILNRLRSNIEKSNIVFEGRNIKITISIGVSFCKANDSVEDLIKRADEAVYMAKENGRNRIEVL